MTLGVHLDADVVEPLLSWQGVIDAIVDGHTHGRPEVGDTLLRRGPDSLLSRTAFVDGLGSLVKTATVFPGNAGSGRRTINGAASLFSDVTGELDATIDFHLLTKWKTAADSALAAQRLAVDHTERILIIGSGTVAAAMIDAYGAVFPDASIAVWGRTRANAIALADAAGVDVSEDLVTDVAAADVICTATMSDRPVLLGRWLRAGQHVDLIGGYRPDMRETDDEAMAKATVFVDSIQSALDVGDILAPLTEKIISTRRLVDFAGLIDGSFTRTSDGEITICKNAGGAHLDLMVARHMFAVAAN